MRTFDVQDSSEMSGLLSKVFKIEMEVKNEWYQHSRVGMTVCQILMRCGVNITPK
jgi:hypothetical protein